MPKTTVGFATKRLFLCNFKIDRMIVLFLFLFVCFYLIFEDKFECIALSCFSFVVVVVVVVVGIEGLNTGLPREFPVFVLIFFFFFASILQKVVSKMEEAEHALYITACGLLKCSVENKSKMSRDTSMSWSL